VSATGGGRLGRGPAGEALRGGYRFQLRAVVWSSGWNLAATLVIAAYSFFLIAFLLHRLGPTGYAPWAAAISLIGYLSLLDAGLSATTTREAARASAGDETAVGRIGAANALFAALAVGAGAIGLGGAYLIPSLLGLHGADRLTASAVAGILTIDFVVVLATAGWVGVLRGHHRFHLVFAGSLTQVLVSAPVAVVLIGPLGLVGAAFAQLLGRIASRLVLGAMLRRVVPWFRLLPGLSIRSRVGPLWTFSLPIFALQLATQIGVGTDVLIVAAVAGGGPVGPYAAGSQLVRNVAFLLFPILSVLLPTLSRAAFNNHQSSVRQLPALVLIAGILGGASFGGLAAEASPVITLWTGRQPALSVEVLSLYALAYVLITPVQILVMSLIAVGRHPLIGAVVLVDSVVNAGLSIVLAHVFGPIGVAVATLTVVLVDDGILIPILASRRLALPVMTSFLAMYGGITIGLAIIWLGELVPIAGIPGLLIRIAICGPLALLVSYLVWEHPFLDRLAWRSGR
jgi:O-antigen/teichoic acid export membrane protein